MLALKIWAIFFYSTTRYDVIYVYLLAWAIITVTVLHIYQDLFIQRLEVVVKQKNTITVTVEEQWMSEKELREELKWSPFLSMFEIYTWVSNEHMSCFVFQLSSSEPAHAHNIWTNIVPEASHPGSKESFGSQSWHSCQETRVAAVHDSQYTLWYIDIYKPQRFNTTILIAGLCKTLSICPVSSEVRYVKIYYKIVHIYFFIYSPKSCCREEEPVRWCHWIPGGPTWKKVPGKRKSLRKRSTGRLARHGQQ